MKNTIAKVCLLLFLSFATPTLAQDIHFNPFNATPFYINPAYTGMFDGKLRISGAYTNIANATYFPPYNSLCLSADMPVYTAHNGNYVATGVQMIRDQAGDGDYANFTGLASVAYHQLFGKINSDHNCDLSIGAQGVFSQKIINLSAAYYGVQFVNGFYPYPFYRFALENDLISYTFNAGISFSQSVGSKFNYTIGLSANNINQSSDAIEKRQNELTSNTFNYAATFGANIALINKLVLRPAFLYQFGNNYNYGNSTFICGTELQYAISRGNRNLLFKNVFLGAWYRSGGSYTLTAGTQFGRGIRLALGADHNGQSAGINGFEIQLQYVLPQRSTAHRRAVPCSRF